MGICNVTPDSFSDGGKHHNVDAAIAAAIQMEADGAAIVDIGGESTRPYSDPVAAEEELARVIPVIDGLKGQLSIPISIDTSKATVAAAAIEAGAEIINDVTGLEGDPDMVRVAVESGAGVCVMHMKGTPQTMQNDPAYANVVQEIRDYLIQRRQFCIDAGIDPEKICLDPGIGFGKTHQHNLELIRSVDQFTNLGSPILIGHSRKGFIGKVLGNKDADRTAGTLAVSLAVAAAGAHVIRVHDVQVTAEALKLFAACTNQSK
ncbi:Dihydropteroate synthase [Rubripirellula obstinata]|uniref:Dihydropteroate synthase n=2 Tax=Rubripirellula obstinata TaxID=406547 RepID=A0A5B1CHG3_9BACT|nr:Dihydropteroate synthase [Rubripirellula obstinata]